jgi:hypothetical protein
MEQWNEYIGDIWADVLKGCALPDRGTLVEIAPGGTDKIGRGLKALGWQGTIYLVDPHREALEKTLHAYKALLPASRVIGIAAPCDEAPLPPRMDALISNHPLDDMIIGHTLDADEFTSFFADHYASDPETTRSLWQKKSEQIGAAVERTVSEWSTLMPRAAVTVIAQYESSFFRQHQIDAPDRYAKVVLDRLRNISRTALPTSAKIADPQRWLIAHQ